MLAVAVAALAALTYANTLGHGFVWDDPISLERWLPALPSVWSAFFPPPDIPQFPVDYYRPVQLLSYRLDRAIGAGAPWPFHLSLVLWHALATALVFGVGMRLFAVLPASWRAAPSAAALFAVHPIHSESVAWMAARPDVMVTCGGLAALLAYWHSGWTEWRRSIVAATLVLASLFCKENAVALLVLVPASLPLLAIPPEGRITSRDAAGPRGANRLQAMRPWAALLPFAVAGVVYLLMRSLALGRIVPETTAAPSHLTGNLVAALGMYLRLLFLPYPQSAYISELPGNALAVAANLLAIAGFALLLGRAWFRNERPLSFALLWIVLTLAPSLLIVAEANGAPVAERYLYLPSVGSCWAIGALAVRAHERSRRWRLITQIGLAALVICGFAMTVQRNRVWRNNHTLWSDTAAKNLIAGLPLRNLAVATLEGGDPVEAERLFHEALARRNDVQGQYSIYSNLGTIAFSRDDAAAESYYRQAFALQPTADCAYNLGLLALRRGMSSERTPDAAVRDAMCREARDLLEQAVAASPHDPEIHVALGQAAQALGDSPVARRHFAEALRLGLPPSTESAVRRLMERR